MKKLKVYIDFEAVASPFAREAKLANNFPYAYTLGLYVGKNFRTRTFVFNFQHDDCLDVYDILKTNITKDIKTIKKNERFKINDQTVEFVGWDPILENRILNKIFPSIKVVNLNSGNDLSLSRITPEIKKDYFEYVRRIIQKSLSAHFIKNRVMDSDGAVAAYVGYLLYSKVKNKKGKYMSSFDTKGIIKELVKYSKDDVLRMEFLVSNDKLFTERRKRATQLINEKTALRKSINNTEVFIKKLKTFGQKQSLSELVTKLETKINKWEKEKSKLEENFDNF